MIVRMPLSRDDVVEPPARVDDRGLRRRALLTNIIVRTVPVTLLGVLVWLLLVAVASR